MYIHTRVYMYMHVCVIRQYTSVDALELLQTRTRVDACHRSRALLLKTLH